jgi:hypothetical protein
MATGAALEGAAGSVATELSETEIDREAAAPRIEAAA